MLSSGLFCFVCELLSDYFSKAWLQNRIHEKSCDKCILNVASYIRRPGHLLCSCSRPIIAAQGRKSLIQYTGLPSVFLCGRGIWGHTAEERNPLKIICWEVRGTLEPLEDITGPDRQKGPALLPDLSSPTG